jgi:hypothetical protein
MALLLIGSCGGDAKEEPAAVTVPESVATTTAAAADEYAIPAQIDEAYVNKVMAALEHVQGDVVRKIFTARAFAQEDLVPLRAVFHDPELSAQAQGFARLPSSADRARNPVGDNITTVVRLITVRADCIYVEVLRDYSQTVIDAPAPSPAFVTLRPSQPGTDPRDLNPTPWSIDAERQEDENRCA